MKEKKQEKQSDGAKKFDVFISYSRKDVDAVKLIKDELERTLNLKCWMDIAGIESGSAEFTVKLIDAICGSTVVLFLLSDSSQKSRWTLNELRIARDEGKHVVLVRFNDDRMLPKFKLEFGGSDIIDWRDSRRKSELLRNIAAWTDKKAANKNGNRTKRNYETVRQAAIMKILGAIHNSGESSCELNDVSTATAGIVCCESFSYSVCASAIAKLSSLFRKKPKPKVIASSYAPSQARRNTDLLVSVFLHTLAEAEAVQRLAGEIQKNAQRRSYKPLACKLEDGDKVDIMLNIYGGGKLLSSQVKSIVWRGVQDYNTFRYYIAEDLRMDEVSCEVNLSMNNVPMGEMIFNVEIGANENVTPAEFDSREYKKIFISYSHEDRDKVKYLADAYKLEDRDYFFDQHYLRSGDVYPEEIRKYIDTSDLFILCWSANASRSEYVRKELSQALNLAYPKIQPRERARLTIRPICIDPRADPPDEMKDIYNFEEV